MTTTQTTATVLPLGIAGATTVHLAHVTDTVRAGSRQLFVDSPTLCGKNTKRMTIGRTRTVTCKACHAANVERLQASVDALEAEAPAAPEAPVGSVTWLLEAATRLEAEGQHELAAEARAEAQAAGEPAPSAPAVAMRCEDCGRTVGTSRMPADWSLDWWSHRLNGRPCQ